MFLSRIHSVYNGRLSAVVSKSVIAHVWRYSVNLVVNSKGVAMCPVGGGYFGPFHRQKDCDGCAGGIPERNLTKLAHPLHHHTFQY